MPKLHFGKFFSEARALVGLGTGLAQAQRRLHGLSHPWSSLGSQSTAQPGVPLSLIPSHRRAPALSEKDKAQATAQAYRIMSDFSFC